MPSASTTKEEKRAANAARLRKADIKNLGTRALEQLKEMGSLEKYGSRRGQGRKVTNWIKDEYDKRIAATKKKP